MSPHTIEPRACPCEEEIVDLLISGRWMDEDAGALRAHAAQCGACTETLALAQWLRDDQQTLCDVAPVPSAGAVWWRATLRARAEAARTAGQPITLLQGIAAATAIGLIAGLTGAWWRSILPGGNFFGHVGELVSRSAAIPASVGLPLLVAIAACLVVAPLAVYLATADEP